MMQYVIEIGERGELLRGPFKSANEAANWAEMHYNEGVAWHIRPVFPVEKKR